MIIVHERIGARIRGHGSGAGGRGLRQYSRICQGLGQVRRRVEKLTAEALDSDLDRYHFEAP
jgi:THO complex subunit 4